MYTFVHVGFSFDQYYQAVMLVNNQCLFAFPANDVRVTHGVAKGDPLSAGIDLILDDVYRIASPSIPLSGEMWLDSVLTFISSAGIIHTALVINTGHNTATYLCPISDMKQGDSYRLIEVGQDVDHRWTTDFMAAGFAANTPIAMVDGSHCLVGDLRIGDRVLTRDGNSCPLTGLQRTTHRATGLHAPALVPAGMLGNSQDLILHGQQPVFGDANRPNIAFPAHQLAERQQRAGFFEYCTLEFHSEIAFNAGGIWAPAYRCGQQDTHEQGVMSALSSDVSITEALA